MRHPALLLAAALACITLAAGCSSASSLPTAAPSASIPGGAPSFTTAAPSQSASGASSGPAPGRAVSPAGCDASLWQHVYHAYRLHVISQCKTVTGTVEFIRHEPDGDLHIDLKPDDRSLLNAVNVRYQHGELVLEAVCWGTVTQTDAVSACRGITSRVPVPQAGAHVRVTGSYVLDADHGWMEIHPVSRITVTGHAIVAPDTSQPRETSSPAPVRTTAATGCYTLTNSGNCYEPGEYCRTSDHGTTGTAGNGEKIICEYKNGWRWEPV